MRTIWNIRLENGNMGDIDTNTNRMTHFLRPIAKLSGSTSKIDKILPNFSVTIYNQKWHDTIFAWWYYTLNVSLIHTVYTDVVFNILYITAHLTQWMMTFRVLCQMWLRFFFLLRKKPAGIYLFASVRDTHIQTNTQPHLYLQLHQWCRASTCAEYACMPKVIKTVAI